jgi:hypothetical protein
MVEERIIRTTSSDQAEYAIRFNQFLNEEGAFKLGFVKHGSTSMTLLRQMYRIKVFKHYVKKDKDKAMAFIDRIDELGAEIQFFIKGKDELIPDPNFLGTPKFKELDGKFDELIAEYYLIESECGI